MAKTQSQNIIRIQETRDITYKKKSAFFGLITWYEKMNAEHLANDIVIILRTPVRKIYLDNNGELQEINIEIK